MEPSSTAKEADHSEDGWQHVHQEDQIIRSARGLNCKGKTLHMGSQCPPGRILTPTLPKLTGGSDISLSVSPYHPLHPVLFLFLFFFFFGFPGGSDGKESA